MDTKNHTCRTRIRAGISGCTSVTGRIRDNSFLLKGGDSTACKSFLVTLSALFIKFMCLHLVSQKLGVVQECGI